MEYSEGGELLRRVKEVLKRMERILGCRIRAVEKTGTPLARQFSLTRLWEGMRCGRDDCTPCNQEGEELYPCMRRNVTYLNIFLKCNPGGGKKVMELNEKTAFPSVYVGETGRSLYERGKDHWRDSRLKPEESHIHKHHQVHHGGEGDPLFHLRPAVFHRSALNRQITEAVKIGRLGGEESLLNSRGEYNRSHIVRLTLGEERKEDDMKEDEDRSEDNKEVEAEVDAWEEEKTEAGLMRKKRDPPRGKEWKTTSRDREEDDLMKGEVKDQPKRLKYNRIDEGWGEVQVVVVPGCQPYIPLPQRQRKRLPKDHNPATPVTNLVNVRLVEGDIRKFVKTPEPAVKMDTMPRGIKRHRGEEQSNMEEEVGPFEETIRGPKRSNRCPEEEEDRVNTPVGLKFPLKTKQQTLMDWFKLPIKILSFIVWLSSTRI